VNAARVGQVLAERALSVLTERREVLDEALRFALESARAGVAPPILVQTGSVVLAPLVVKTVGDFVADNGAYGACANCREQIYISTID
jgi:hypothetical protein